jgi:hypothetical protein
MKLSLSIFVCLSTLLLSACDPRFKITSEECAINQPVRASFVDFSIKANDDKYQPYLQDMLTALQVTSTSTGDPVTAEQQQALDNIDEVLKAFMPFEKIDNEFVFTNSLDMLEAIMATTDPATVIETDADGQERNISNLINAFKTAKQQMVKGINADNGDCRYTNSNIIIENYVTENPDTDASTVVFKNLLIVLVRMTYDPFTETFVQSIGLTQTENDPDDPNNPNETIDPFNINDDLKTIQTSYGGGFEALPSEVKAVGYTLPYVRSANISPEDAESSLQIFDYYDSEIFYKQKLTDAEYVTFDAFCTLKDPDGEIVNHDSDTLVITGDTLTINSQQQIIVDGTIYKINDSTPTIVTLIKDGEVLVIDNNSFTITGITVVLDEQALLINSSTVKTVTENQTTFSVIECADDIDTIEPVRDECNGGFDSDGVAQPDERNRRESRTFDLNAEHTKIKRLRIETDFAANEVRVYVSKYKERVLDADEDQDPETSTIINDPSRCEKQAILTALSILNPNEGVSLKSPPDPNYDQVFKLNDDGTTQEDENGSNIIDEERPPTPAYTFTGMIVPTRQ